MDPTEETGEPIGPRVIEALSLQARLQLELFRAELERDLWSLLRTGIPMAVGVPLIGVGYVFASVAAALAIASVLGPAAGTAIIGTLNILLGLGFLWFAHRTWTQQQRPSSVTQWIPDEP